MKKLWGGRFSGQRDLYLEAFGASIGFDQRLAPYDIQGSVAHATMLGETGIIAKSDADKLVEGLHRVSTRLQKGELEFRISDEDIHMNIERYLSEEIGEAAGRLHTARSRNDQVALDLHLFLRDHLVQVVEAVTNLQSALVEQAEKHDTVVMPGYTHLQRAQPILFAHHLLAYVQMLSRDCARAKDLWSRVNTLPLGAGALAGTTFPIDRERVAQLLKFDAIYENSLDAVSDRDFAIEFHSLAAILMMHLSRLCEEIVIWTTGEFGFIELADSVSTGSSMMPQKKNPDFAELVRGKTGRVYGSLLAFLTTMKGLPLAYNKDMQEDKEGLFDCVDTVLGSLYAMTAMVQTWTVKSETMRRSAEQGFTNATDAADYLVKKGTPFREAHEIVGKLVRYCIEHGKSLLELSLEELKNCSSAFSQDIFEALKLETVVNRRESRGGTGNAAVSSQLGRIQKELTELKDWCGKKRGALVT